MAAKKSAVKVSKGVDTSLELANFPAIQYAAREFNDDDKPEEGAYTCHYDNIDEFEDDRIVAVYRLEAIRVVKRSSRLV